jgi:hypothetical protein
LSEKTVAPDSPTHSVEGSYGSDDEKQKCQNPNDEGNPKFKMAKCRERLLV